MSVDPLPADADPQNPSPQMLLWAYRNGIFPMADPENGRIDWYRPDPRAILPLTPRQFHVPSNLARLIRQGKYKVTSDTVFEKVIRACALPRSSTNLSWLNERMITAYISLHELGHAHSVEAWFGGDLVGGLYGVHVGAAFFGESMFVRPPEGTNASKVCLMHLVNRLRDRGFMLLDTQFWTEHLDQFGCIEIPVEQYENMLEEAVCQPTTWAS